MVSHAEQSCINSAQVLYITNQIIASQPHEYDLNDEVSLQSALNLTKNVYPDLSLATLIPLSVDSRILVCSHYAQPLSKHFRIANQVSIIMQGPHSLPATLTSLSAIYSPEYVPKRVKVSEP